MKNLFRGNIFDLNFNGKIDISDIYNLYRLTTDDETSDISSNKYSNIYSDVYSDEYEDNYEDNYDDNSDESSIDILHENVDNEQQLFIAYKNMRMVLAELEEGSKIREKLDDYNLLVVGMVFYSINKFILNSCLSDAEKKAEFVLLTEKFQIECIDMEIGNLFDIMSNRGDWYRLSEEFCKYDAADMGNFWEVIYLMSKLCDSQEMLNAFLNAYLDYIKKMALYLSLKYSELKFISQAELYMNDLVNNLSLYVENN